MGALALPVGGEVERELAECELAELLVEPNVPPAPPRAQRRHPRTRLVRALLHRLAHRLLLFRLETAQRRDEHEVRHTEDGRRVGHRDDPAVRPTEQVDGLELEVAAQLFQIVDVVLDPVGRRVGRPIGPARAARVEQDEREGLVKPGCIAEPPRRETGPTGMTDEIGPEPRRS